MTVPRIAHVGCGYWGKNLARNFAGLGALSVVVDGDEAVVQRIAVETGTRVASLDAVLTDPAIAGISIATPAPTHFRIAKSAIEAGKHVFVEKPLALDVDEARQLIELARQAGIQLMVGHLLQYHPVFRKMRKMVGDGEIGPLRYVYSNRMSLGKFRTEENVLWSFAPHDISMILALAGSPCTSVTAQGAAIVTPGIEDWALAQLAFENGLKAHVQTSWLHPFKEQRLVAICQDGMLVFEDSALDWNDKLMLYRHRIDTTGPVPLPHKAECERIAVPRAEPLREECRHFLDCIATNASPLTDGREGLAVLEVIRKAGDRLDSTE